MLEGELKPTLEELRRVRTGALQPGDARGPLATYLGMGVGRLCDLLAAWIEEDEVDRRGVDATLAFYGLSRMPEPLVSIAARTRSQWDARGLTARRVEQLTKECILRVERREPPLRIEPQPPPVPKLQDPFSEACSPAQLRAMRRVMLWAWADATGPPSEDAAALLLYEFEHGLRERGPAIGNDRKRRLRLRRRAWSMLDVAMFRRSEAEALDWLSNRSLGPRFDATTELLPLTGGEALAVALVAPAAVDLYEALDFVRSEVRDQRPWGRELLGLLRDVLRRSTHVPKDVNSKVLALTAIDARLNRDPSGMVAAEQALALAYSAYERGTLTDRPDDLGIVSDALRAGHEGAQLAFAIGDRDASWRMFQYTKSLLSLTGDPERDTEPSGWEQMLAFFEASWRRAGAARAPDPGAAFEQALTLATDSMEIVFDDGLLPIRRGLNAESQRVGTLVDYCATLEAAGLRDEAKRLARVADRELAQLEAHWTELLRSGESAEHAAQTQSGLLSAGRHGWRLAVAMYDLDRIEEQRLRVVDLTRASRSGFAVEKLESLERASEAITGRRESAQVVARAQDRGALWAT